MGVSIKGISQISLTANSNPVQLSTGESTLACVRDNVKQILPTLEFRFLDISNSFSNNQVADGSTLDVVIGDGNTQSSTLNFLSFGSPHKSPCSLGYLYNVHGIGSMAPILRECPSTAIEGTSLDVFKQAATKFNITLKTNLNSTDDNMVWRPGRQSWGTFLRYVANHAYSRDGGFISTAIDSEKNLYLIDVPQVFAQTDISAIIYNGNPQFSTAINTQTKIPCIQYKHVNRAGFHNNTEGFGSRVSQTDPITGDVGKYSKVKAQTSGNNLDISSNIYKTINQNAKLSIAPINSGNGHDNYIKARHQNNRLQTTYSNNLYVLLSGYSNLPLYSKVYFKAGDTDNYDEATVGFYILTGKVRFVKGGRYFEKIELTNSGPATGEGIL